MTIGDHVALWNGSLRHKMHTPAPPRLPCWSSAQVTLVYNGPLTQDKPLSVGAAQKTSCVPRGISTSPPLQPIHPREGKMAQSTHRAFLPVPFASGVSGTRTKAHPSISQESLAATTRVAARGQSSLVDQIAAIGIIKHSFSTGLHEAEQGKKASAHISSSE